MRRLVCLGALVAVACGSSDGNPDGGSGGGNSITGTVHGQALNVQDAIFTITSGTGDPFTDGLVLVAVADRSDLCTLVASTTPPSGTATVLAMAVAKVAFTGLQPLTNGAYVFSADVPTSVGSFWTAAFASGTCTGATQFDPSSAAALNVTQVGTTGGTHLKANFSNLSFGTEGTLSGTVDATYCAALNNPGNDCLGPSAPLRWVPLPEK
jgi:hypothetical protein